MLALAILVSIVLYAWLFSDGGPGTPKRIRIPIRTRRDSGYRDSGYNDRYNSRYTGE
jgi:hypothetical protein